MAALRAAAFGRTHLLCKESPHILHAATKRSISRRWDGGAARRGLRPNPFAVQRGLVYPIAAAKKISPHKGD